MAWATILTPTLNNRGSGLTLLTSHTHRLPHIDIQWACRGGAKWAWEGCSILSSRYGFILELCFPLLFEGARTASTILIHFLLVIQAMPLLNICFPSWTYSGELFNLGLKYQAAHPHTLGMWWSDSLSSLSSCENPTGAQWVLMLCKSANAGEEVHSLLWFAW